MTAATLATPRHVLRAETAPAHARLDAFFGAGLRHQHDYHAYLLGLHALTRDAAAALAVAPLSRAWRSWGQLERVDWLARDLDTLCLAPLPPPPEPELVLDGDAAAAGLLYVLEGSTLGARLLVRDALRLGHARDRGAVFLHGHAGDGAITRWRAFVAALDGGGFVGDAERAMLASAAATFRRAEAEFRRARLHVTGGRPWTA